MQKFNLKLGLKIAFIEVMAALGILFWLGLILEFQFGVDVPFIVPYSITIVFDN